MSIKETDTSFVFLSRLI